MASARVSKCIGVRRRRIVDAATRLFSAAQYDAVQVDDVARAAGVAKPTLYRYFATKEDLFLEGLDAPLGEIAEELTAIAETSTEATQALPEMMRILLDRLGGDNAGLRVLEASEKQFGTRARAQLRARAKQIRGSLAAVLRRGIEQREFRDIDADLVASALIGSLRVVATKIPGRRHAAAAHAIADLLIGGIASYAALQTSPPPMQAVARIDARDVG